MIRVVISGILGKMGQVLKNLVEATDGFLLVGGVDLQESGIVVADFKKLAACDIIIDFSMPAVLPRLLDYAVSKKIPVVLATTGYQTKEFDLIAEAAKQIPIFYSANYSVGIHLLNRVLKLISKPLSADFDIELVEKHHHFKKDHPSGTAIKLVQSINDGLDNHLKMIEGPSDEKGIHVHALRLGNYVGEHQVIFSSMDETLELVHIAHDKKVFASGALKATKFLINQQAGLFGMDDLLGGNT